MIELWQTIDSITKTVVILSSLAFLIGIVGFLWFMIGHAQGKKK